MLVRSGTYTGNGGTSTVGGVGFPPDFVVVVTSGQIASARLSTFSGDVSMTLSHFGPFGRLTNRITSLTADGFTIGNDAAVNANGTLYYYLALRCEPADSKIVTYTGDGLLDRAITGVGFQPDFVQTFPYDNVAGEFYSARFRTSWEAATLSSSWSSFTASDTDAIRSFQSDGFTVGTGGVVNTPGRHYHALCLKAQAGVFDTLGYTGTGTDNRTLSLNFTPVFLAVQPNNGASAVRPSGLGGDQSLGFGGEAVAADRVQSLLASAFQVGSTLNASGEPYRVIYFRERGGVASVGLVGGGTTATAGETVAATWAGVFTPELSDQIGLYALGAARNAPLAWTYTSGTTAGTVPFPIPLSVPTGSYELRLYGTNVTPLLATAPLTITGSAVPPPPVDTTLTGGEELRTAAPALELWLLDIADRPLAELDDANWEYSVRLNQVSEAKFTLSRASPNLPYALAAVTQNTGISIRARVVSDGTTRIFEDWGGLVETVELEQPPDGRPADRYTFTARHYLDWLRWRRIIPPPGEEYHVLDNAHGDVAAKTAVRANLTDPGTSGRLNYLYTEGDRNLGGPVNYAAPRYISLYDVVTSVCGQAGLDFNIVRAAGPGGTHPYRWGFYTYYPRLGNDRTPGNQDGNAPVVFSVELGTLSGGKWGNDRSAVANVAYVGGQGTGLDRQITTVADEASIVLNGWRETFVDARSAETYAQRVAAGTTHLALHSTATQQVSFTLPDVGNLQYRRDWGLGDVVTVRIVDLDLTLSATITEVKLARSGDAPYTHVTPTIGATRRTLFNRLADHQRELRLLEAT
jgi:hypothetical protein